MRGLLFELVTSYYKATKQYLLDEVDLDTLPDAIFNAPFVCVAHDRAPGVVSGPRNMKKVLQTRRSPLTQAACVRPPLTHAPQCRLQKKSSGHVCAAVPIY